MTGKNTFGEKLRAARKAMGLTQKELAQSIGAKHNSISDWENDKNMPDPDTIVRVCETLKVEPGYLLMNSRKNIQEFDSTEILYVSKPSGDMKADEVRKFLHELIDELKDEDLLFMKDFSLRMVRKETAYATERKPEDCSF